MPGLYPTFIEWLNTKIKLVFKSINMGPAGAQQHYDGLNIDCRYCGQDTDPLSLNYKVTCNNCELAAQV